MTDRASDDVEIAADRVEVGDGRFLWSARSVDDAAILIVKVLVKGDVQLTAQRRVLVVRCPRCETTAGVVHMLTLTDADGRTRGVDSRYEGHHGHLDEAELRAEGSGVEWDGLPTTSLALVQSLYATPPPSPEREEKEGGRG